MVLCEANRDALCSEECLKEKKTYIFMARKHWVH
jgi:hypothetical protein